MSDPTGGWAEATGKTADLASELIKATTGAGGFISGPFRELIVHGDRYASGGGGICAAFDSFSELEEFLINNGSPSPQPKMCPLAFPSLWWNMLH